MSATEVAQRMAELSRVVGAPLSRIWNELFTPYLERVVYILNKRGLIDLPKVNDKIIAIIPESPLARAARNEDITQFTNFAAIVAQMFGQQALMGWVKEDKVIPQLAEWYSTPASFLRNSAEREEFASGAVQAAQGASEMGIDPVQALKSVMP